LPVAVEAVRLGVDRDDGRLGDIGRGRLEVGCAVDEDVIGPSHHRPRQSSPGAVRRPERQRLRAARAARNPVPSAHASVILIFWALAAAPFGIVTVRTPCFSAAFTFAASTGTGNLIERLNEPRVRSTM